jgi:hypothetical protein
VKKGSDSCSNRTCRRQCGTRRRTAACRPRKHDAEGYGVWIASLVRVGEEADEPCSWGSRSAPRGHLEACPRYDWARAQGPQSDARRVRRGGGLETMRHVCLYSQSTVQKTVSRILIRHIKEQLTLKEVVIVDGGWLPSDRLLRCSSC